MMECRCVRAKVQKTQNFGVLSKNVGKMSGSDPRASCFSGADGSMAEQLGQDNASVENSHAALSSGDFFALLFFCRSPGCDRRPRRVHLRSRHALIFCPIFRIFSHLQKNGPDLMVFGFPPSKWKFPSSDFESHLQSRDSHRQSCRQNDEG